MSDAEFLGDVTSANCFVWHLGGYRLVFVHSAAPMSSAEWERARALVMKRPERIDDWRSLVITDGGAPTMEQRKEIREMGIANMRSAIVSDATMMRFIVSSLSLFNSGVKSFSTRQFEPALKHVGYDADVQRRLLVLLSKVAQGAPPGRFTTARQIVDLWGAGAGRGRSRANSSPAHEELLRRVGR